MILPARSPSKAQDAISRIQREVPRAIVIPEILDLGDLSSVRVFAGRLAERFPRSISRLAH